MSTASRIGVLAAVFATAAVVVAGHLFVLMVSNNEVWAARSHENRWAFRSVPSLRGAIRDRFGRVLVHDEPTTEVSLYYLRFRLRHPVGAAVHGATIWARLHPGRQLTNYGYAPGALGPEAAARDLLAMPAAKLRPGELKKEQTAPLAKAVVTLMATTSGLPRRQVYKALREAGEARPTTPCGAVLDEFTHSDLLRRFDEVLAHLRWFDAELAFYHEQEKGPLFAKLEELRVDSLGERRVKWTVEVDGEQVAHEGDLYENIAWPVSADVPFDLAAGLRLGELAHPGLLVRPALRRQCVEPEGTSLRALLGLVSDLGRLRHETRDFETYARRELPEDWVEDFVPEDATLTATERARIRVSAERRVEGAVMRYERAGRTGIELGFDAELSGQLGMRLVERDSRQREKWLWSNLRVRRGEDVTITIDTDLQQAAEQIVRRKQAEIAAYHDSERDRKLVLAAMALVDARSGDVLAFAGAPVNSPDAPSLPGMTWSGDGAIGSVAKPFVLVEQLASAAVGRPHRPLAEIEPCRETFRYGGTTLHCGHSHGAAGQNPAWALARSCNSFFYQVAVGLGEEGVARALQRFGLQDPEDDPTFAACWQGRTRGLPSRGTSPKTQGALLPLRAIGYGTAASPLSVARAYAGIATGRLPMLGLLAGQARPAVSLAGLEEELAVVREGLRGCVEDERGTARGVSGWEGLHVHGKTGTAEVSTRTHQNNAWFAGYLPGVSRAGIQLCFCAVVYWAPDGHYGADVSGGMLADVLAQVKADPVLRARYIPEGGGR